MESDDEFDIASESSPDESYVDMNSSSFDSDSNSAMGVDPLAPVDAPVEPDEDGLSILTARNASQWCKRWLSTANSQALVMMRWHDALHDYHFCTKPLEVSSIIVSLNSEALTPHAPGY